MNNYAISSDGIATALQDSASALMEGGNNLEQATALVAAANRVVQDPNSVGSALRTISLRLRGTSVEILEEMGEETDGAVESVSKMQSKIKALAGVDIVDMNGAYKDTYTILKEIGQVWEEMDDMDQAALLELMAGKNRANTLAAILGNMEDLEGAYESALNAEGSALRENEAYLDSIQGRIDILKNAWQTFWMNLISSDTVKAVVDALTKIIQFFDKLIQTIGVVPTLLGGLGIFNFSKDIFKGFNLGKVIVEFVKFTAGIGDTDKVLEALRKSNVIKTVFPLMATSINEAATASQLFTAGINGMGHAAKNVGGTILKFFTSPLGKGIGIIVGITTAITLLTWAYKKFAPTHENALEKLNKETEDLKSVQSELKSVKSELETTKDQISKLESKDTLTFVEQSELERLRELNAELEREQRILKESEKREKQQQAEKSVKAAEKDANLKDQKTRETLDGVNYDYEISNSYEKKLRELEQAQESLDSINKILESDTLSTPRRENWEKKKKDAEKRVELAKTSLKTLHDDFNTKYGDTGYFVADEGEELTAYQKQWNDIYRNIQYYGYREAMIGGNMTKSEAMDGVFGYTASEDAKNFEKEINAAFDGIDISGAKDDLEAAREELNAEMQRAVELDVDFNKTKFGNIDTDDSNRILEWTKDSIDKNRKAMETWGWNPDEFIDSYSTILGSFDKFAVGDGTSIGIAFSPMLQTPAGPKLLDQKTVHAYINELIKAATNEKGEFDSSKLISLDAAGITVDGQHIRGLLADIGESAEKTSQQMHFVGETGSIASAIKDIDVLKSKYDELTNAMIQSVETILDKYPALKPIFNTLGISAENLMERFKKITVESSTNIIAHKSYDTLASSLESLNDVQKQTHEILTNGTTVTQEYKDTLIAMVGSEEKVNECFVDGSSLIVKNADGLEDLITVSKKNIASQTKLAKTQARLRYAELYKKIKELRGGEEALTDATRNQINAYYAEMTALQGSISKYTILEQKLLGATNAYERLAAAQEIDAANDYGGQAEELANVLATAFNTAELGTESAKVAISGLIPDEVFEDAATLDEAMKDIHEYFTEGEVSKLFEIKYGSDGSLESVEMTKEKIESYANSLFSKELEGGQGTIFQGTWDRFNLNPAITSLEEFADACDITEEVAFAFLTSLEKYDISHLFGDGSTILDQLMGDDLEYHSHKIVEDMADLEHQLTNNKITVDEYQEKMYGLNWAVKAGIISEEKHKEIVADLKKQLDEGTISLLDYTKAVEGLEGAQKLNNKEIRDNTVAWVETDRALAAARERVETATKELEKLNKQTNPDPVKIQTKTEELKEATQEVTNLLEQKYALEEPTQVSFTATLAELDAEIAAWQSEHHDLFVNVVPKLKQNEKGEWTIPVGVTKTDALDEYVNLLNQRHTISVLADGDPKDSMAELESCKTMAEAVDAAINNIDDPNIDCSVAISQIQALINKIKEIPAMPSLVVGATSSGDTAASSGAGGGIGVNGTAHASGNWGTDTTETALMGELGPEIVVDPSSGSWHTVGDNGAEFTKVKRGSIIFNHKQTEQLLKNGYVTGRGKLKGGGSAFASGTAHAFTIGSNNLQEEEKLRKKLREETKAESKTAAEYVRTMNYRLGVIDTWDDAYKGGGGGGSGSGSGSDKDDDKDDEIFDWIEVRLEELQEKISLKEAELENASNLIDQNKILDKMIDIHQNLYDDLIAGSEEYNRYAATLLEKVPAEYREAAKNGSIAIEEFAGEADAKTLEAIQNYREWVQKAADVTQQAEETLTTIRDLAIKQFENAREWGNVRVAVEDSQTEKLQNAVDLDEARGLITSDAYYLAMMENSNKKIEYLTETRNNMQKELDDMVASGKLVKGSNEWYELINEMYGVDEEIADARIELEEFQNSINDLKVERFDELIERLNDVQEDTQDLIDLMSNDDMFVKPDGKTYEGGTIKFWGEDDVAWTDEGLATLGLYAQQSEVGRVQAQEAAKAIDELTKAYHNGELSEIEYREELDRLKDVQFDGIKLDKDAQKAIRDLKAEQVDYIKQGIEKEIEAYEELINKKKETLNQDKSSRDYKRSVSEKQKEIADLEMQIAALAGNNSASARAQRARLEAEVAERQQELDDIYYDHSIEVQEKAYDDSYELFKEEKEAEIEGWDKYLENTKVVNADMLNMLQANADKIGEVLTAKAEEYNLTVSDAVLEPWKDGASAISAYQESFNTAVSATTDKLNEIVASWQKVIDKTKEAGKANVDSINAENARYAAAEKAEDKKQNKESTYSNYTVKDGDTLWDIAASKLGDGNRWQEIYSLNKDIISNPNLIQPGWNLKLPKYAKGTTGVKNDQWSRIDELGEELVMHADGNGKLAFLSKGSAVIPHDISKNLMELGRLDPQDIIERNRPVISAPHVTNNETIISIEYGDILHIDNYSGGKPEDLSKMVDKAFDKHMKELNQQIRRYTR